MCMWIRLENHADQMSKTLLLLEKNVNYISLYFLDKSHKQQQQLRFTSGSSSSLPPSFLSSPPVNSTKWEENTQVLIPSSLDLVAYSIGNNNEILTLQSSIYLITSINLWLKKQQTIIDDCLEQWKEGGGTSEHSERSFLSLLFFVRFSCFLSELRLGNFRSLRIFSQAILNMSIDDDRQSSSSSFTTDLIITFDFIQLRAHHLFHNKWCHDWQSQYNSGKWIPK